MDDRCAPHDDEETRITTSETRYQQLLSKNARPEGVNSERGVQSAQALRLQTSNKKELKAGISCNLCYIITSDNALMEQHLMGLAHIRNVDKEARKCRDKIDFQKKSNPTNETIDAIASDVEESHCLHDRFDMVESVIEDRNINNIPHCDETLDNNCLLTLSMKNKNNEVIKVQDKTMDETNNADCELCKYFQGDKYQIPEHFCPNFYEIPELPAGWTEKTSRTSGCSYYINNVTKVRQWNWPSQPAIDELPHGWVEKKAKSNGLTFYVNKVTNDWQWDRPTKVAVDLSASTSKDGVINSDNSPGMTKGMMVSKMKVTSCKSKQEALVPNEVEKLKVKSPIMAKTGVMISNLNESSTINHEDQLKVDLMHWKQATEQWNSL